ncbi:MAG: YgfZ/GcvT domain-containing protein, partial [Rhodoluna sp.]
QAQRQLIEGKALVNASNYSVITVSGQDRLPWLHSLLSQNIKNLNPGQSTQALLLDPNGHVEQVINLIDDGNASWLIVDSERVAGLLAWLQKMVFRMQVEITDHREDLAVVASWGLPAQNQQLAAVSVISWQDGWTQTAAGGHRYGAAPTEPWALVLNVVSAFNLEALKASQQWAGIDAIDALRIAAHRPTAAEVDQKSLPHELDLLASAVHLSKGCYRGQETVAKVHNLGHPPRRLVLLHLDGSGHLLPAVGDAVVALDAPDQVRGKITAVGQHHEMGPIAFAVVARSLPIETLAGFGGARTNFGYSRSGCSAKCWQDCRCA